MWIRKCGGRAHPLKIAGRRTWGEGGAWSGSGKNLKRPQGWIAKRQKVDGGHLSTLPLQGGWTGRESQMLEQESETISEIIRKNYPIIQPLLAWCEV